MPRVDYLLQGIESDNHLDMIKEILSMENIEKVIFSVAFMRSNGFFLVEEYIKPLYDKLDVYVGIRNDVTSIQAIVELIKNQISTYLVDTGSSSFIFHPKIFIAYNKDEARIIMGSANATSGGFLNNIEASALLHLDRHLKEDEELLVKILGSLNTLITDYPYNVTKILNIKEAIKIKNEGRLVDERISISPNFRLKSKSKNPEETPRMKLKVKKVSIPPKKIKKLQKTSMQNSVSEIQDWVLAWESNPLKESHLNIPSGRSTNNKGSLSLGCGLYRDIDQRHYFRDNVFNELDWIKGGNPRSPEREQARANFQIIIKGISYGLYSLELSHDPRTDTPTYLQNNYMTDIKWGESINLIKRRDLLGHTLRLYKPCNKNSYYIIAIEE